MFAEGRQTYRSADRRSPGEAPKVGDWETRFPWGHAFLGVRPI